MTAMLTLFMYSDISIFCLEGYKTKYQALTSRVTVLFKLNWGEYLTKLQIPHDHAKTHGSHKRFLDFPLSRIEQLFTQ